MTPLHSLRAKLQCARLKKSLGAAGIEGDQIESACSRNSVASSRGRVIPYGVPRPAMGFRDVARYRSVADCSNRCLKGDPGRQIPRSVRTALFDRRLFAVSPMSRRSCHSTQEVSREPRYPRLPPSRNSQGTNRKYLARVSSTEVPGKSVSLRASLIRAIPNSSRLSRCENIAMISRARRWSPSE